jgi:hypothetical protein
MAPRADAESPAAVDDCPGNTSVSIEAVRAARTRTGAKEAASGNETRSRPGSTPFRAAASRAAAAARARYSRRSRWRGFGAPPGSNGGVNSRGKSSRSERAPESATRSTARCARAAAVSAPPSAASKPAAKRIAKAAPIIISRAWPRSAAGAPARPSRPRASRPTRVAAAPPTSRPAIARREATRPSGRAATRVTSPRSRSSATASATSARSVGRSARSRPARGRRPPCSRASGHSRAGRWTIANLADPTASSTRGRSPSPSSVAGSPSQQSLPRAVTGSKPVSRRRSSSSRACAEASMVGPRRPSAPSSASSTPDALPGSSPTAAVTPTAAATAKPPPASPRSVASTRGAHRPARTGLPASASNAGALIRPWASAPRPMS